MDFYLNAHMLRIIIFTLKLYLFSLASVFLPYNQAFFLYGVRISLARLLIYCCTLKYVIFGIKDCSRNTSLITSNE